MSLKKSSKSSKFLIETGKKTLDDLNFKLPKYNSNSDLVLKLDLQKKPNPIYHLKTSKLNKTLTTFSSDNKEKKAELDEKKIKNPIMSKTFISEIKKSDGIYLTKKSDKKENNSDKRVIDIPSSASKDYSFDINSLPAIVTRKKKLKSHFESKKEINKSDGIYLTKKSDKKENNSDKRVIDIPSSASKDYSFDINSIPAIVTRKKKLKSHFESKKEINKSEELENFKIKNENKFSFEDSKENNSKKSKINKKSPVNSDYNYNSDFESEKEIKESEKLEIKSKNNEDSEENNSKESKNNEKSQDTSNYSSDFEKESEELEIKSEKNEVSFEDSEENNSKESDNKIEESKVNENNQVYFNDNITINIEENKISETSQLTSEKMTTKYINMMSNKRENFLEIHGKNSLYQPEEFLESLKEKFYNYNKMFGDSKEKKVLKELSPEEKHERFLEKEALIEKSTTDVSKKMNMRLLMRYFHDHDIDLTINKTGNPLMKEFFSSLFQKDLIYIKLKLENTFLPCSFVEFINQSDLKLLYKDYFRIIISEITDIPIKEIVFVNFKQGSLIMEFVMREMDNINDRDPSEKLKKLREKISRHMGNLFPLELLGIDAKLISFINKLSLSPYDFDELGDFRFPNPVGDEQIRGGSAYFQPCNQWRRFGLLVKNIYDTTNQWLSMDGNPEEWAVAFHGTSRSSESVIGTIIDTREIIGGKSDWYGGTNTGTPRGRIIPKGGIYCAWKVENSYIKVIALDGRNYEVAFQCRINPKSIFQTMNREYVVVSDSQNIRPYGFVIREL